LEQRGLKQGDYIAKFNTLKLLFSLECLIKIFFSLEKLLGIRASDACRNSMQVLLFLSAVNSILYFGTV
jgi:hypothetical protein